MTVVVCVRVNSHQGDHPSPHTSQVTRRLSAELLQQHDAAKEQLLRRCSVSACRLTRASVPSLRMVVERGIEALRACCVPELLQDRATEPLSASRIASSEDSDGDSDAYSRSSASSASEA